METLNKKRAAGDSEDFNSDHIVREQLIEQFDIFTT
jgi:hypothetical protein